MIREKIEKIIEEEVILRGIISKPKLKTSEYRKIDIQLIAGKDSSNSKKTKAGTSGNDDASCCSGKAVENCSYQISKYTQKQVFHENVSASDLAGRIEEIITDLEMRQMSLWTDNYEYIFLLSKKGELSTKRRALKAEEKVQTSTSHNRQKNYIISEGSDVPPLVDMGVFTKDGKVVKSMYDKFRQINRFLEILDDEIDSGKLQHLNVIDFGCGKSYLTFVVYYYLTEIKGITANIIGLDLKADVIKKCNQAALKYGYENLHFELGDINGYKAPFDVDMVITLHACDTATDYALYNAVQWNARMIFSVPCCQHELNKQIESDDLALLTRYGIIKERFAALATDAIRGNLLEYMGYRTQLLEFVDFAHTPKNILIRAVKKPMGAKGARQKALDEVESLMKEFHTEQTLYNLLIEKNGGQNNGSKQY
ncbi:class I SAM-dependent methyltransferase [Butyrivibrio sp. INlla14]|uniref:class I SAM-dependent methyltransferase n=1 Tax=Butyrivibrio sp. INlla14 TaxID=1520808 RepID=UPI0008772161|nr:SAM-dependent methyltransferase [Butyrivibrio sp. INlla14]SCY42856.1 SAM-dependent methyltransferase [Butyrivibrio sp. INlla14]